MPSLAAIDHVHVFVGNRAASERWYRSVLGLAPVQHLEFWAVDGGPLTLANAEGNIHLALFERPPQRCRSTVAFAVDAPQFLAWREHLRGALRRELPLVDHQVSWSMYFEDPDGNPYEITSYEVAALAAALRAAEAQRPDIQGL
jgi:catechol-2,3-dioxygenase